MDLRSIYITNGVGAAILLILYFASKTRTLRNRIEDRVYTIMIFGVMLGCVAEVLSYVLDGKTFFGARVLNYVVNTYIFSANVLLVFLLLIYVDLCLYGDKTRIWKRYKPQIIVGVVMILANVVNYFVPISYYISELNVYERRPFSYAYYAVIVYYCVSITVLLKRFEKENGARAFFKFGMFVIPVVVGVGLQFLVYGLSLAWLASAIGLVGLFMMQQNEMAYIDSLVSTYNRQYLDHILAAWISRGETFVGAMVDIDKFKSINDNFGHSVGDEALKDLTRILKQAAKYHEHVFRFAGDEFIVLKLTDTPRGLDRYMKKVKTLVDEFNAGDHVYKLSISYGISFFDDSNVDTFLKEMDDRMYEMKANGKQ